MQFLLSSQRMSKAGPNLSLNPDASPAALARRSQTPPHHTTAMSSHKASCSCGQLTATTSEGPIRVTVCHCLACQRHTGSVFGAQARFSRESVTISGQSRQYVRVGDAGSRIAFHFCPECGATVYYALQGHEEHVAIPVGGVRGAGISATCTLGVRGAHAFLGQNARKH